MQNFVMWTSSAVNLAIILTKSYFLPYKQWKDWVVGHKPSSFSISSLLGDHLSCSVLSSDRPYTSLLHHSPQLVRNIWSGSSGKSSRVNARRRLSAPVSELASRVPQVKPLAVSVLPSETVFASGISVVTSKLECLPRPVPRMRPGETATTSQAPLSCLLQ